jgi:hypothetical protein
VGKMMTQMVWFLKHLFSHKELRMGTRKARVLPVPDLDWAIMLCWGYLAKLLME